MRQLKTRKLNILLAKQGYSDPRSMVNKPERFIWKDLDKKIISGQLAITKGSTTPSWVRFVNDALEEELTEVINSANSALLFVNVEKRMFILSFGYGRNMLKEECFVRDFGLKTVLNTVDPTKIKSIDSAITENITKHTRSQTSIASPTEEFGLDVSRDILRAVTGHPKEEYRKVLGRTITGKDSLHILVKITMRDLEELLEKILELYESDSYKENFDWVDNLREEKDPSKIKELKKKLVDDLNSEKYEAFHLAIPEIYEPDRIESFAYFSKNSFRYTELDIVEAIKELKKKTDEINFDTLKNKNIYAFESDTNGIYMRWSLAKCIVYETEYEDKRYVLTMGNWYCIEPSFAKEVTKSIEKIKDVQLISCQSDFREDQYNEKLAKNIGDAILFDKKLIKCTDARSRIELCDVLTKDHMLIHVKKRGRSSTLSHLFSQGKVSAEALLSDAGFLNEARNRIEKEKKNPDDYLPDTNDKIKSEGYTVVFAIIDKSDKPLSKSLPFFSLLNFRQVEKTLKMMGYKVAKAKIDVV